MGLGSTTRQTPLAGCPRVSGAASEDEHLAPWTQSDHGGRTLHQTKRLYSAGVATLFGCRIAPCFGIKYPLALSHPE